ncbi:GNAT family N-acetyltransferase [uncultured Flavobacterium sp.]|uniref:GNAT family N-acetyltransferase n=1 Tax=uncultured Flavobacterium sp. TaxID=165435 RepID=UPI0025D2612A|nr:GNAT family N-acetyltransferase [uncultured Flavobacterium sp.]
MANSIFAVAESEYDEITDVWEASVRATHHFLAEEHILYFRPLIRNEYLKAVKLFCTKSDGAITGFIGTGPGIIEMLFIRPDARGKGIGRLLTAFSINDLGVTKVDVNEQNAQAAGFYEKMGFAVVGRSELDGLGLPYPILHMELKQLTI